MTALCDSLECRRMLAGSARFDAEKSILRVFGDDGPNQIEIRDVPSFTTGNSTGHVLEVVVDNTPVLTDLDFSVKRIIIYAGSGNDSVLVPATFTVGEFHPINSSVRESSSVSIAASIDGGAGDDTLFSGDKNDTIVGGDGKDQIFSRAGDDTVFGGAGGDRINSGNGRDLIRGNGGSDRIDGGDGDDTLFGNAGNDTLAGQNDNDTVDGDEGDDFLAGGLGSDQHFGGTGTDTADYSGRTESLRIELLGVIPDGFREIPGLDDQPYPRNRFLFDDGRYSFDERVRKFIPPRRDDDFFGCGRFEGDGIVGVENARGGEGDDVILGNEFANHLAAGGGDDTIFAGARADTLLGNAGDDSFFTVDTRDGSPRIITTENPTNPHTDKIDGGPGDDFARFDPTDSTSIASVRYRERFAYLFS